MKGEFSGGRGLSLSRPGSQKRGTGGHPQLKTISHEILATRLTRSLCRFPKLFGPCLASHFLSLEISDSTV